MAVLPGDGTVLQHSADNTSFTTVSQRVSLEGPDRTVTEVETTDMDSTAKTFRASGIPDNGTVSGSLWYDPSDSQHSAMRNLMASPATAYWKLILNDEDGTAQETYTFNGILTEFGLTGQEVESNVQAAFSIKVSGGITVS